MKARRVDALAVANAVPWSDQAEQSVIGGLMLDNSTWDTVADCLLEDDFYRRDHRLIFAAISRLADRGHPFDIVTLNDDLTAAGALDDAGGMAYLITLAKETPSAANIAAYARIVRDNSELRQVIAAGGTIANAARTPGAVVDEVLQTAEQTVFKIAERRQRSKEGPVSIRHLVRESVERMEQLHNNDSRITGLSTGFGDLDEMLGGLQPADLIIVGGRPSMGKTSLAMQFAEHAALDLRVPTLVFSMEMPGRALSDRMLASVARIDSNRMRRAKLEDDEWPRLASAVSRMGEADELLAIDDTGGLSPWDLRARARRWARQVKKPGMIVVDYLQLMVIPGQDNRTEEVSEISRQLKLLAKELNVPVVALSQLNRNLEDRPDKRPRSSDLRSSGSIEQDADVILFLYRDEVYKKDSPDKGIAEIIIGKQRNGPVGTVRLAWLGEYTRFENLASDPYGGEL